MWQCQWWSLFPIVKYSLSRLTVFPSFQTKTQNAMRRQESETPCVSRSIWAERGHTGPRFELMKHHQMWLFQNHLNLNTHLEKSAEKILNRYRQGNNSVVGVHVRRTDYAKLLGGNYPHNPQYYSKAVEELRERWGTLDVVVLSDDMAWCRSNIQIKGAHFIGEILYNCSTK